MQRIVQGNSQTMRRAIPVTLIRGLGWGLIGGLAGTMVMDLVLMGVLSAAGRPALTCFSIVGNTLARFFSLLAIDTAGGAPLGVATHYLVGPMIGAAFGVIMTQVDALRVDGLKKSAALAVLYVEILSQPLLATTPILLKMTVPETLQWFGGASLMHLLVGAVLGVVMNCGLQLAVTANHQ